MTWCRIFVGFFTLGFLAISAAAGQESSENQDLYEAYRELWSDLRHWQDEPIPKSAERRMSAAKIPGIFKGYEFSLDTLSRDTLHLTAHLPLYAEVLTTQLQYRLFIRNDKVQKTIYIAPFTFYEDTLVYDDSISLYLSGETTIPPDFEGILKKRFHGYRTLNLPSPFAPRLTKESIGATLYFHGRDLDSLTYSSAAHLVNTLRRLASGLVTYAVPLSIVSSEGSLLLDFCVVFSRAEASGHHFLLLTEEFSTTGDSLIPRRLTAHLYPYVRMNNLVSLYGTFSGERNPDPIPIKIDSK